MCSRPMVGCGWRRRSVGDPGLKMRMPSADCVQRDVGVAEHDELGGGEAAAQPCGPALGRAAVVDHRDREPGEVQFQGVRRAPGGDVRAVVVAADRAHRGVAGELVQHAGRADVPGVQDQVRGVQVRGDRRRAVLPPPRRVRVGQDRDLHPGPSVASSRSRSRAGSCSRMPGGCHGPRCAGAAPVPWATVLTRRARSGRRRPGSWPTGCRSVTAASRRVRPATPPGARREAGRSARSCG